MRQRPARVSLAFAMRASIGRSIAPRRGCVSPRASRLIVPSSWSSIAVSTSYLGYAAVGTSPYNLFSKKGDFGQGVRHRRAY